MKYPMIKLEKTNLCRRSPKKKTGRFKESFLTPNKDSKIYMRKRKKKNVRSKYNRLILRILSQKESNKLLRRKKRRKILTSKFER